MFGTSVASEQVVHERSVEQLSLLVVHELLIERVADAVRHTALNLASTIIGLITRPQSCTTT